MPVRTCDAHVSQQNACCWQQRDCCHPICRWFITCRNDIAQIVREREVHGFSVLDWFWSCDLKCLHLKGFATHQRRIYIGLNLHLCRGPSCAASLNYRKIWSQKFGLMETLTDPHSSKRFACVSNVSSSMVNFDLCLVSAPNEALLYTSINPMWFAWFVFLHLFVKLFNNFWKCISEKMQ